MRKLSALIFVCTLLCALAQNGCVPKLATLPAVRPLPGTFQNGHSTDTLDIGQLTRNQFFTDSNLIALIDTALQNNQELNIALQEVNIAAYEVRMRTGEYLPFVSSGIGASAEHTPRYTRNGAVEENLPIAPGRGFPEPLANYRAGLSVSWEVDIWRKLRNAKQAAVLRYYASQEGRLFLTTNLVAEIASSYYELLALDNELAILNQNLDIQQQVLSVVRQQKEAARVTELAVRRFEAELLRNQSRISFVQQQITATEYRLNQLVGRIPQPIRRSSEAFPALVPPTIQTGVPAQLVSNRPDIRLAEFNLQAARIDVKVAKANFYPSLVIDGNMGFEAFNFAHLLRTPESLGLVIAGGLMAPVINRNGLVATYNTANANQIQRIYEYEQKLVNAYTEVATQLANINNLQQAYDRKFQQVQTLSDGIAIAQSLFRNARADYGEVLLTQREYLEARVDLVELKMLQLKAVVDTYRALGGGWQ